MDPVSLRQYDKIFKSGEVLITNISSQSIPAPIDRLHSAIADVLQKVNLLKLDDDEFDNPRINMDTLEDYSKETIYDILMMKFTRMVQIVRDDEGEIQKLIQNNQTLKEQLAALMRSSDQIVGKAQEEVQQLIESNSKINTDATLGKADAEKMEMLLFTRQGEVHKLKTTQKQLLDEFVLLRQKQQEVGSKAAEIRDSLAELRNSLEDYQEKASEGENIFIEKQKELEDLRKQRKVLEAGIKQNQQKLQEIVAVFKKKSVEYETTLVEYKRTLAKNSSLVKQLDELEKEKEAVGNEIAQKTSELAYVRSLNEDYEFRANKYPNIETYYRIVQDKYYKLMSEAEVIKQQINELAPHSFIDVTPQHSIEVQNFSALEKGGRLSASEEERLANLSPEEIEKEIQFQKQQIKVNQLTL